MKKGIMALEGLEEVISNPEVEAPAVDEVPVDAAQGDELIDINQIDNQGNDIDDLLEDINDNSNVVATLESIANILSQSKDGLTPNNAKPLNTAIEHLLRYIDQNPKVLPAMEAFGGTKTKLQATMESIEKIKEVAGAIWKKIVETIKLLIQKIKNFFFGVETKAKKANESIKKTEEILKENKNKEIKNEEDKIVLIGTFYLNDDAKLTPENIKRASELLLSKLRKIYSAVTKAAYELISEVVKIRKGEELNETDTISLFENIKKIIIDPTIWEHKDNKWTLDLLFNGMYIEYKDNSHNREKQFDQLIHQDINGTPPVNNNGNVIRCNTGEGHRLLNTATCILPGQNYDREAYKAIDKLNDYFEKVTTEIAHAIHVGKIDDSYDNVYTAHVRQILMESQILTNLTRNLLNPIFQITGSINEYVLKSQTMH